MIHLFAFRSQMRDINRYLAWETGAEGARLVFTEPVLTLKDLNAVGVFPEPLADSHAVLKYRRIDAPVGAPADCDIHLHFKDDRLSSLQLPGTLSEGLGQNNIRRLFATVGGREETVPAWTEIPKARLLATGLFTDDSDHRARVALQPADSRNGVIEIELWQGDVPGHYGHMRVSVVFPGAAVKARPRKADSVRRKPTRSGSGLIVQPCALLNLERRVE